MLRNNVLVRLTSIVFTIVLLLTLPIASVDAEPWPGGTVEPVTQTNETTTINATIPEAVTTTHYTMAAGVLLFFIFTIIAIIVIRGG